MFLISGLLFGLLFLVAIVVSVALLIAVAVVVLRAVSPLVADLQHRKGLPPGLSHTEAKVHQQLSRHLDPNWYAHYHNITFLLTDGTTTQVDHVVLLPFGIFVIETKGINGWIFGREDEPQWTVKLGRAATNKMMNPLHQNYRHTCAIRELTVCPAEWLKPVVVFTELKTHFPKGVPAGVLKLEGLMPWIQSHRDHVIAGDKLHEFSARLSAGVLPPGSETDARHLAYARGRMAEG